MKTEYDAIITVCCIYSFGHVWSVALVIGKYLLDKTTLARMIHAPVCRRLAPIIGTGEAAS
jgi:hypothetical protein